MPKKTQVDNQKRLAIFAAMRKEREYQINKYGEQIDEFNRATVSVAEYILIMERELEEAKLGCLKRNGNALEEILQVMTVGMACLMMHGLRERKEKEDYWDKKAKEIGCTKTIAKELLYATSYGMGSQKIGKKLGMKNRKTSALIRKIHKAGINYKWPKHRQCNKVSCRICNPDEK